MSEIDIVFKNVLDGLLEGIQIISPEWRYVYVNDAAASQSHFPKEKLVGRTMMEMYPAIEKTELFGILHQCMTKRIPKQMENKFVYPDNTMGWFKLSIQPSPNGLIIMSEDITLRKQAEDERVESGQKVLSTRLQNSIQQLKESEEKFQKAFKTSAAGMSITRLADSIYLEVNDAFVNMCGYSREELTGHSSKELGIVINVSERDAVLNEIIEKGFIKDFELTIKGKSGKIIEVLGSIETITLNDERYAINIFYDITDRKRAEEKLKEANEELAALNEELVAANEELHATNEQLITLNNSLELAKTTIEQLSKEIAEKKG